MCTVAKKYLEKLTLKVCRTSPLPLNVTPSTHFSVPFVCKASSLFAANAKVWELA